MVAVVGLGLLWIHFDRYPALDPSTLSESALALPRTSNLWAILRALAWLALINVSAICLGAGFERWLPVSSALARFRLLYQLGIGFSLLLSVMNGVSTYIFAGDTVSERATECFGGQ